jgi:response regulator RpfG family c-di-GMP phosphodiesterase
LNTLSESAAVADLPDTPCTVLFVDDEANILSALRRLFRPRGYVIHIAESGAAALAILEKEPVDLVVSDMRMPEMNGAQLLEQVRNRWPETVRILLTGYSEMNATVDAINKGGIYRYIAKPWEENDLAMTVRNALEGKRLVQEKKRLEALTLKQNEELVQLNASLEEKVAQRTAELQKTMDRLKKSFIASIHVFSNLMELRDGATAGHSRRVADTARRIALKMGLTEVEAQEVMVAGLLHDIGKLALPDNLFKKPFAILSGGERTEVCKHPINGQAALMALDHLKGAAKLIRSHRERFDGQGFPDGLAGAQIPLGARILAVASDYDALQCGTLLNKKLGAADALKTIGEGSGKQYDPTVVETFLAQFGMLGELTPQEKPRFEETIPASALQPGMVLAHDLMTRAGILLISKEYIMDEQLIKQIRDYEREEGSPLHVRIRIDRRKPLA